MGLLPFALFSLATATGPHEAVRASAATNVVLNGRVEQLTVVGQRVFALLTTALVVLDPNGNIVRRLELPKQTFANPRQRLRGSIENANRALFDKADYPESLRHTAEAERWLQDEASAKVRPSDPRRSLAEEKQIPVAWKMVANQHSVYLASELGLWKLDPTNNESRLVRIASIRRPILHVAVSPKGKVLLSDAHGDVLIDSTVPSPIAQVCDVVAMESEEVAVFDAETTDPKMGLCGTVVRAHRRGATVWLSGLGKDAQKIELHAHSLAACGTFGLINADEGLFVLSRGTTTRIASRASFPLLRCNGADPDTVISFAPRSLSAAFSENLGRTWHSLPALEAQDTLCLGVLDHTVWAGTAYGLLRSSTTNTQREPTQWQVTHPASEPKTPVWMGILPIVRLTATVDEGFDESPRKRSGVQGIIAAEFPIGAAPKKNSTALDEAYSPHVISLSTPDKPPSCLSELRWAAAQLAMTDPIRVQALTARSRTAAWLPELRVRAEKRWGRNQSVDLEYDTTVAPLGLDTVNDFRLEVRASWDLSRLVYSPDELAIFSSGVRAANAGQDLSLLVNRLFFQRRQHGKTLAMALAADTKAVPTSGDTEYDDTPGAIGSQLRERIAQITADLDALTGGLGNNCW